MSRWVDVLNRLRASAQPASLAPSQRRAAETVVSLLGSHGTVNLHGPPGSGKSYLGWVLARATGARVVATPSWLPSAESRGGHASRPTGGADHGGWATTDLADAVIVDGCLDARLAARVVMADAHRAGFRRVLLVTRRPVGDHVPHVELRLDAVDVAAVLAGVAAAGWAVRADTFGGVSLWDHVWHRGVDGADLPGA